MMLKEAFVRAFDDMFEHLGQEIEILSLGGNSVRLIAVIKQPEDLYNLGDSPIVDQISEVTIKASEADPRIGDHIICDGKKYKICSEPLLDASNYIRKFHAVLVENGNG